MQEPQLFLGVDPGTAHLAMAIVRKGGEILWTHLYDIRIEKRKLAYDEDKLQAAVNHALAACKDLGAQPGQLAVLIENQIKVNSKYQRSIIMVEGVLKSRLGASPLAAGGGSTSVSASLKFDHFGVPRVGRPKKRAERKKLALDLFDRYVEAFPDMVRPGALDAYHKARKKDDIADATLMALASAGARQPPAADEDSGTKRKRKRQGAKRKPRTEEQPKEAKTPPTPKKKREAPKRKTIDLVDLTEEDGTASKRKTIDLTMLGSEEDE